jgi:hypothetical protein
MSAVTAAWPLMTRGHPKKKALHLAVACSGAWPCLASDEVDVAQIRRVHAREQHDGAQFVAHDVVVAVAVVFE